MQMPERGESEPWKYAALVRWGALAVVVIAVVLLLFRLTRRPKDIDAEAVGEEERSSVFSTDLAREQLRNLFRRGRRGSRLPRLNLDQAPSSVRDAWRYLQVLALRQDVGRGEAETPQDFAARLRAVWPGTAGSLNDLAALYERSRYGDLESERDDTAAADDWRDIYRRRRESDGQRQG
jgi:hypothetical protein